MALKTWTTIKKKFLGDPIIEQRSETIRSAAVLTGSYVDSDVVDCPGSNQLIVFFKYTPASLTSLEYQVWWSLDNSDWYQETAEQVALGTTTAAQQSYTIPATGNFFVALPVYGRYFKTKVKGTGTATGSSLQLDVLGRY